MAEHQENPKKMQGKETLQLMAAFTQWMVESILPKKTSWAFVSGLNIDTAELSSPFGIVTERSLTLRRNNFQLNSG